MTRPDDIRNIANYTYSSVAGLIGTYGANVCRWLKLWGDRSRFGTWKCSYYDLSASLVVKSLRREGFSLHKIRVAYRMGLSHGINNVLLHKHLCHDRQTLLFRKDAGSDRCYRLDRSGIIEVRDLIDSFLKPVHFDPEGWTYKLHPCTNDQVYDRIIVDPEIGFGYPVIKGTRISTSALASYYNAGDSKQSIVNNFNLNPEALDQALAFERAAAANVSD